MTLSAHVGRAAEAVPLTAPAPAGASAPGCRPGYLADGKLDTADSRPKLEGARWTLALKRPGTVIGVRVHQSARKRGWSLAKGVLVHVGKETVLPLDFDPGRTPDAEPEGWRWTRVPQVASDRIVLEVAEVTPVVRLPGRAASLAG